MAIDKNAVIQEARKLAAKGQFDKAIAEWKKLIKASPNDPNIYNTIGDLCLKKDSKDEAVEAYQKAAELLASDGFTSKAIALYKKVLNIDPKKVDVHVALGDLNAEKGLTGNAIESYKLAADYYSKEADMGSALGIYQKMADLNPSNVAFRLKLADMYAKEGLSKEAAKAYLAAADAHMSKDAFQEARQIFEKVLSIDPGNKDVYHKAGVVYSKEGKFAEACKAFKPAFEADPKNKELADAYLDVLSRAGKTAEAEETVRKLLSLDAGRIDLREKLYGLYLSKKEYEKALHEASTLADIKIKDNDLDAAEGMLKGFVAEAPDNIAGRRKLSDVYLAADRKADAVKELLQAAETLIAREGREEAKGVLGRAIEIAPDQAEARQMLEALEAMRPAAPPVEEAPIETAAASPEAAIPLAPAPQAEMEEEDPAITEAFTEIDVLVKYGLTAKALEQLESLSTRFQDSPLVRIRLRDMYLEQKNIPKAVQQSIALADVYSQRGMEDRRASALQQALEMDPGNTEVQSLLGIVEAPPEEAAPLPAPPTIEEPAYQEPAPAQPQEIAPEEVTAVEPHTAGEELMPEGLEPPSVEFEGPPQEQPPPFEGPLPEGPPPVEFEQPGQEEVVEAAAPPAEEAPPSPEVVDISEIWAEAEFYYQQGLFDEARKHYESILEHAPSNAKAKERLLELSREKEEIKEFSKLAEAVEGLESLVPSEAPEGEMAASVSDEEAVRALMEEIKQLRREERQAAQAPGEKFVPPQSEEAEEDFFDLGAELREEGEAVPYRQGAKEEKGSEDFFDLAAELRDELGSVSVPSRPLETAAEQSLEDIFAEFKKGVEEQAGKEDTDTHYNLGIAYKEMGLLDDAINEFMTTPEGEPKFIESRYMLGLCYLEKGDYQTAITEITNALGFSYSFGQASEERIGMHYDLGLALQGVGQNDAALQEFQKVCDLDPGYRDVATKMNELQKGEFISIEAIKEDIEREISAKFLEEGERIEREEKTKKGDKIRN